MSGRTVRARQLAVVGANDRLLPPLPDPAVGYALLALGALYLLHAIHVVRHPDWRRAGYWSRHRRLAFLIGGFSTNEKRGASHEFVWAALLLATGVAVLVLR
jgi:hypothetical protein